ncbi:hypothetical protein DFS33DRAFT_1374106 [Desarmillaria ectypa]|nr:hypothetical protein DFS33DRAFT_1374106 [Desarmillaria ectypa]
MHALPSGYASSSIYQHGSMDSFQISACQSLPFHPRTLLSGVFVGGTSGVGEAIVKTLTHYTSRPVHLIIVVRNRSAAEKTFASIPNTTEGPSLREPIYCDAASMTNIEVLAKQISEIVNKINFLALSAGYFQRRLLSLRYYSRFRIIHELLPLLHRAQVAGEDAKVTSVLGVATGIPVNVDDLGEYAKHNPDIVFTHIWPDVVNTAGVNNYSHWLFASEECAVYMLFALLEGTEGFYLRDHKGNTCQLPSKRYSFSDEQKQAVWDHSVEVTRGG